MEKSKKLSEEICDGLIKRINGYSNSNTLEGQLDALTDIVLDMCLQLKENRLITKKQLRKLTEKYPEYDV